MKTLTAEQKEKFDYYIPDGTDLSDADLRDVVSIYDIEKRLDAVAVGGAMNHTAAEVRSKKQVILVE